MQKYGGVYYDAIDLSVQTAEAGYAFSTEAIELCGALLDPDNDPTELNEFIEDMKLTAKQAHEQSRTTVDKFQEVRSGLFEACFLLASFSTIFFRSQIAFH